MPVEGSESVSAAAPQPSEPEFRLERILAAPRKLVFAAWTEPRHLARWWGPKGFTDPVCEIDPRPGGAYRLVMCSPEGIQYPMTGVFREIVKPERIVMTMDLSEHPAEWHDLVKPNRRRDETNPAGELITTVIFEDLGERTRVTVRTRFGSVALLDAMLKMGMTEGWSQSLRQARRPVGRNPNADTSTRREVS